VALAEAGPDQLVAYVADEDTKTLYTVDLSKMREVATTPLDG
jgi:hypothetical protein